MQHHRSEGWSTAQAPAEPRSGRKALDGRAARRARNGLALASLMLLVAPLSLHGDFVTLGSGHRDSPRSLCLRDSATHRSAGSSPAGALAVTHVAAESQLRLRGGKGAVKKAVRSKSVTRSGSPKRSVPIKSHLLSRKRKMKAHNLGPAEWMKKLKRPELQRKEISMKGFAKGRKKPVFHFWTKTKIKKFTEDRIAFRAKRRERKEKVKTQLEGGNKSEIIHAFARGWKNKFSKWLPSIGEQRQIDEIAAKQAAADAKRKIEEKEAAGGGDEEGDGAEGGDEEGGGDGDEGGDVAPQAAAAEEEEDDFMMGGFGGDSDGSGLF